MSEVIGNKKFICRVVEGRDSNGQLKCPSEFASFFGLMGLNNIGLHLPNKSTWLGRFVRHSERIEGIESLMKYFDVKPCYLFAFEYFGGTEFLVSIYNDYALEVNYTESVKRGPSPQRSSTTIGDGVFDISEIDNEKLQASFAVNAWSSSDGIHDFGITREHLQGADYTQVLSKEEADEMGLKPEDDWLEIGTEKFKWRIQLHWRDGELWFDKGWNVFAEAFKLGVGDRCFLRNTTHGLKFKVAIHEKHRMTELLSKGGVEGKGVVKWFKMMTWMSVHTGEVEVPYLFGKAYASAITDNAKLVLPDGFSSSCYFSKNGDLLYGLKDLMIKYSVRENCTIFFNYIGNSTFYVTIYNEAGMGIFNDLPEKLSLHTAKLKMGPDVIVLSDSDDSDDESIDSGAESGRSVYNTPHNSAGKTAETNEGAYDFNIELLKSHVDGNGHGVYLPRYLNALYRRWSKGTVVKLVMKSKHYQLAILRRKKTCRLGLGWNEFTRKNKLHVGQRLSFTFVGNATFKVNAST